MKLYEERNLICEYIGESFDTTVVVPFQYKHDEHFPMSSNFFNTDDDAEQEVFYELNEQNTYDFLVEVLSYHNSWDMLMPVIGRISDECEEPDELDNLKYALLTNNIQEAYRFVVDYIKYLKL